MFQGQAVTENKLSIYVILWNGLISLIVWISILF